MQDDKQHSLALFIDFENIALGMPDKGGTSFDIKLVIERMLDKGQIIVKRAYSDWSRYSAYKRAFHEVAIELIEIPKRRASGKNSADIRLCVDAMDLCYAKEHVDTFVIVSGDSDFSPLVSKLRENGKRVIGLGLRGSTSNLLVSNCDEFIFYEALVKAPSAPVAPRKTTTVVDADDVPEAVDKPAMFDLIVQTVTALLREGRAPIQASLIKDTIKRKMPFFSEGDYGYRSLTELLEDVQAAELISLREDPRSGTYFVNLPRPSVPKRVPRRKTTRKAATTRKGVSPRKTTIRRKTTRTKSS
jgi:uncharacterized protein (TIGR00288 family)